MTRARGLGVRRTAVIAAIAVLAIVLAAATMVNAERGNGRHRRASPRPRRDVQRREAVRDAMLRPVAVAEEIVDELVLGAGKRYKINNAKVKFLESKAQASDGAPFAISEASFRKIIFKNPRNFSVFALLVANPPYRCRECGSARYALSQVADLYTANLASDGAEREIYFAVLEYNEDMKGLTEELETRSVPSLFFFPPDMSRSRAAKTVPDNQHKFMGPWNGHDVAEFVQMQSGADVYIAPGGGLFKYFVGIAVLGSVLFLRGRATKELVIRVSSYASIAAMLVFMSGMLYVVLKQSPWLSGSPGGGVSWIYGGRGRQLGVEGLVVGALLGFMIYSFLKLIPRAAGGLARVGGSETTSDVMIAVALFVCFSVLATLFRAKMRSYPFNPIPLSYLDWRHFRRAGPIVPYPMVIYAPDHHG